ncbi:MAG: NAD(P)H-dependent oxidoreductase [Crocinitomicaceae bacterium]|nr:NAD(P)H-dependent oxidoreductase [Crocinitomicaceae bacterium]
MNGKKVLVINGHPDAESFNAGLTEAYLNGAKKQSFETEIINIRDLNFNPNLESGYRKRTELEPDLVEAIEKIKKADHLVWIFPMWWYSFPAILKGFIDRTFLPGITYEIEPGKGFPKKLLKGKTGRIIITADTPNWYNKIFMKNPAINQMKKGILKFCGVNPVKVTYISPIKNSTDKFRLKWLNKIESLGSKAL